MFLSLSFFLESPMPLVSSAGPFATDAPSFAVDSIQTLLGRHVGSCPGTTPFIEIELLKDWRLVAMLLDLETPFLL